jgi:hypothetical protein
MIFADRGLVVDHLTGTTHLLALTDPGDESNARIWLHSTAARLNAMAGTAQLPAVNSFEIGDLCLRHNRSRYLDLIGVCHEAIKAADLAIVIRTLVITPDTVSFEETMIKASAITSVLSPRFPEVYHPCSAAQRAERNGMSTLLGHATAVGEQQRGSGAPCT